MLRHGVVLGVCLVVASLAGAAEETDPFMWLEEINGQKALQWVKAQNARTTKVLEAAKVFKPILERNLEILDSKDRIAMPSFYGATVYNFWQDASHVRGIWRRTTLDSYASGSPTWETVIDVDALARADNTPWVFKGAACLPPGYRRCMVSLSPGGGDAAVEREFDTVAKSFVEGGFSLPKAKSQVAWRDENTLWIGTDFGEGSLTTSGYPRIVKLWTRGTPLGAARTIFEGEAGDVSSVGQSVFTPEGRYDIVQRVPAFFRSEKYLVLAGRLVRLDIPEDSEFEGIFKDHLLLSLRSPWEVSGATYPAGALLAIGLDDFLRGGRSFEILFQPASRTALGAVRETRDRVVVSWLDNVRGRISTFRLADGAWRREELPLPTLGTVRVTAATDADDDFFYTYQDFLTPSSLFLAAGADVRKIASMPGFFDTSGIKVEQSEATSKDGTKIPYFVVTPKGFKADGKAPALLYGYGGFEIPELPTYSAAVGASWLERGGVYVLANIRGGGEFGPQWHRAAMKEHHIRNFEDFIAVAEDLVARGISSPRHLGIMGGSQGGLLVSGTFVLRPDLFHAVVAQVPLTDMKRFNHLLAGASWMAEYGDPDKPEDWAYIQRWSPYELLRKGTAYPMPFYWTNTRDDRVHPAHARKMVAKLESLGDPVYYFENIEGGHSAGSVNSERAYIIALQYAYLWKMLR
jgi:prolyl oligopeptidase